MEELSNYYNLSECTDRNHIIDYLDRLQDDSKIEWNIEELDSFKIIDISLDETDLDLLLDIFDEYAVIVDLNRSDLDDYYADSDVYLDDDYDSFDDFGFSDGII